MNKQFGLLWGSSLLITFYLGYSYQSVSPVQSVEINSPDNFPNKSVIKFPAGNDNIKLVVQSEQSLHSKDNSPSHSQITNINEALSEIKLILGNGMNMAGIAKAYLMINDFSQQDLTKALEELENTANMPENSSLLSLLLSKYAEKNPKGSIDYINEHLTSPQSKMSAMSSVIAVWSDNDPLSAYDWFVSQKKYQDKDASLRSSSMGLYSIFSGLAKHDFNDAIDKLIETSSNSENNFMALNGMINTLSTKGEFEELMNRTSELEDVRLKNSVIYSWAIRDPQEAIEWIDSADVTEEKANLQKEVLWGWMATEPTEAASWYLANAEPNKKQIHADIIVDNWSSRNPEKALDWLSQQTEIDQLKSTTKLLKSSVYKHTDFAINNLSLLESDEDKLDVSISIHMTLERNNKKKAADFVEQSTIKEALQKKIEEYRNYRTN
jgi:hypothetical protein